MAAPLVRGDEEAPLVPLVRGVALPLLPVLGETHGVTVAEPLAAADPPADEVAVPLRLVAAPLVALPLAEEVDVPLRAPGLPLAEAVAVPLRAEALADAPADFVAAALAVRLGAQVTPVVAVPLDSLSSPQATAKASKPTAIAIGMRARASWRFISASFLFDCYLNISNEQETCYGAISNCNFITTADGARYNRLGFPALPAG